jgi:L-fucose mutarotase/ribose pyranase (RbsD/FucU family)
MNRSRFRIIQINLAQDPATQLRSMTWFTEVNGVPPELRDEIDEQVREAAQSKEFQRHVARLIERVQERHFVVVTGDAVVYAYYIAAHLKPKGVFWRFGCKAKDGKNTWVAVLANNRTKVQSVDWSWFK